MCSSDLIIEQAFVLGRGGLIQLHHLPPELRPSTTNSNTESGPMSILAMEKYLINEALRRHGGNRKRASEDLGIDTSTLYRKIKALEIETPETDGRRRRS